MTPIFDECPNCGEHPKVGIRSHPKFGMTVVVLEPEEFLNLSKVYAHDLLTMQYLHSVLNQTDGCDTDTIEHWDGMQWVSLPMSVAIGTGTDSVDTSDTPSRLTRNAIKNDTEGWVGRLAGHLAKTWGRDVKVTRHKDGNRWQYYLVIPGGHPVYFGPLNVNELKARIAMLLDLASARVITLNRGTNNENAK